MVAYYQEWVWKKTGHCEIPQHSKKRVWILLPHAPHPLFVLPLNGGDFKEKKIELTQGGVSQPSGEDRM